MKKMMLSLFLGVMLIGVGMVLAIPNPSPIYCENMGYTYNDTYCIFDDNETCELWDFYNGGCGADYVIDLPCKELGEGLSPGYECCENLVSANLVGQYNEDIGVCVMIIGSFGVCVACGDGTCDSDYEDICNCPSDCSEDEAETEIENETSGGSEEENETDDNEEDDEDEDNFGLGRIIRNRVKAGVYTNENGDQIRVRELAQNRFEFMFGNFSARTELEINEETEGNRTRLKVMLKNGRNASLKIMPNVASVRALARLRLKVCNETRNCSIELKEVGEGNKTRLVYEARARKTFKVLWLFKNREQVRTQIDAETGEVVSTKRPWWAWMASESDEADEN